MGGKNLFIGYSPVGSLLHTNAVETVEASLNQANHPFFG
jgi:hypothetical protein